MIKNLKLAALSLDGKPVKEQSSNINQLIPTLKNFSLSWLEFVVDNVQSESKEIIKQFGITLDPSVVLGGYYSNYEDEGDVLGITIPLIYFSGGTVDPSPVLIYISKNNIISIQDENVEKLLRLSNFSDGIMKKLLQSKETGVDRQTILFARIIDEIAERNYDTLRLIVERAQTIEIDMSSGKTPNKEITEKMTQIKRAILTFLTAIWATRTTVHSLRYGDPEMLSDEESILSKFDIVLADLDRQIQLAEQVLEVLSTSVNVIQTKLTLEDNVIQTNITNRLSMIILWLTVIGTAVLVPNTLATVFAIIPNSESIFNELMLILIASTIFSSALAYLSAKKILGSKK